MPRHMMVRLAEYGVPDRCRANAARLCTANVASSPNRAVVSSAAWAEWLSSVTLSLRVQISRDGGCRCNVDAASVVPRQNARTRYDEAAHAEVVGMREGGDRGERRALLLYVAARNRGPWSCVRLAVRFCACKRVVGINKRQQTAGTRQ